MTKATWIEIRASIALLPFGIITSYLIYCGLYDGIVPDRHGGWTTFSESPVRYVIEMLLFLMIAVFCGWGVISLPRRLKRDQEWIARQRNLPTFEEPEFEAKASTNLAIKFPSEQSADEGSS